MITKPVFSNRKAIKAGQVIKENAHRYKQDVEKDYIYQQFINKEKKAKQDEKIQEVHWRVGNRNRYRNDASKPNASNKFQGQVKI